METTIVECRQLYSNCVQARKDSQNAIERARIAHSRAAELMERSECLMENLLSVDGRRHALLIHSDRLCPLSSAADNRTLPKCAPLRALAQPSHGAGRQVLRSFGISFNHH